VKYSLDSAVANCRGYVGWFSGNNNNNEEIMETRTYRLKSLSRNLLTLSG
jgi:hypothetical protein